MENREKKKKTVVIDGRTYIENIYALPKLGAGHDGEVFKYKGKALKLLKYDLETRKVNGLMTFPKAKFFKEELTSGRFVRPDGLLLDEDGSYCGYSMRYLDDLTVPKKHRKKTLTPSEYPVEELTLAIDELEIDTDELSRKKVIIKDLNRGSYIFASNFMNICDMDKFIIALSARGVRDLNAHSLNFIIAKYFYNELKRTRNLTPDNLKVLNAWVKRMVNSRSFLDETRRELESMQGAQISDYLEEKAPFILK